MICETIQQQLIARADGNPSTEVSAHLNTCRECSKVAKTLAQMQSAIRAIPVPNSDAAKAQFLETIAVADLPPIIERAAFRTRDSSTSLRPWSRVSVPREWRYAGGIAAMLLIAFGTWWLNTGPRPVPETVKLRHELLKQEVASLARMTRAETSEQRLAVWTDLTANLHTEAKHVFKIAPATDMDAIERMFGKVVKDGILTQAKQLPATYSPAERQKALAEADKKLEAAETDAETLAREAPQHTQPALKKIAGTAKDARDQLQKIIRGEA
ncbi:MAG: hypothetical protein ACRC8S_03020 [Fimbriiglobus sp.]